MAEPLLIAIGVFIIVLALILPRLLRRQQDREEWRELQKALKKHGRQATLEKLDKKISDKLTYIAKLEANAGMIYAAGEDGELHMEHRELSHLKQIRDKLANHPEKLL